MEVNKSRLLLIIYVTLLLLSMKSQSAIISENETDRLALLAFRYEVGDPLGALSAWHDSLHHCNWTGITCSSSQYPSRVTIMDLSVKSLVGSISPHIGNITFLETLDLHQNSFNGQIPQEIGHLSGLRFLDLSDNSLEGEVPSDICNNTKLEMIHFGRNRLQGEIPPSLGNCHSLQDLSLPQNQLRGTIPKQVMSLSSLSVLDLSVNLLSGNLPYEVGNLEKILYLDLSKNHISGQIPSSLGQCLGLQNLYLQGNLFDGVIPSSLQIVSGVEILDLSRNRLSGQIPEFLGSFVSLRFLNLSFNDFQGEVPKQGIFKNTRAFSILGNDKLCGEIHLPSCPRPGPENNPGKHFPLIRVIRLLLIIFGAVLFAVFCCLFHIFIWRVKAQIRPSTSFESPLGDVFQKVSYNELRSATNGFSTDNLVGVGSYGSVYRGVLTLNQETTTVVAVKVLNLQRRGASKRFMAECQALRCIRHRNLVKILTSCSSVDFKGNEFKSLVLEFMPNGSLENWLHPTSNDEQLRRSTRRSLSFMERLNIAIDIATALDYLHRQCQTPIVHCDLKPSNVLLDDDMTAHIGDFGLAKFLGEVIIHVESQSHTSNPSVGIRGTVGYAAPEYGMGTEISKNGDIYSFGILLLELFTGRRPTDNMFKDGLSLHSFAATSLLTDRVMQIVDPILLVPVQFQSQHDIIDDLLINGDMEAKLCEALTRIVKLAAACSSESPKARMEIVQVVKMLKSIKNLYFYLKIGYIIKKQGKGYNHLQERNERIYNSEIRIMKPKCSYNSLAPIHTCNNNYSPKR
ncbi:probable LRR receptor-like serine/threonine-protein kinase At3g47570 [Papaver somniferum]|uniref:probable LRR receptor-like serine/threonine-protein kinase At3g47570 n=1 Tax=Papaver somniferum TaxID=3469 RepID=UPI000E6FFD60|nr:probable LRR receptor-like serine/threonine-protein kinase At3g47570 [Papaver somniferum]